MKGQKKQAVSAALTMA